MKLVIWFISLMLFSTAMVGLFTDAPIGRVIAMMLVAIYVKSWENVKWTEPLDNNL